MRNGVYLPRVGQEGFREGDLMQDGGDELPHEECSKNEHHYKDEPVHVLLPGCYMQKTLYTAKNVLSRYGLS